MIYITGDIHGDINTIKEIEKFCNRRETTRDDVMILLGDVGINYYGDTRDTIRKDIMSKIPITFLCLRGNHEVRPENIKTYKLKVRYSGPVFIESAYPNIMFLKDGKTYLIEDKVFLALGGAYSVDKHYRLAKGWNWFADEMLSQEERDDILKDVKNGFYHIVLSHTCPIEWEPTECFLPQINQANVDKTMERWLSEVKKNIEFDKWYFGHYHKNKENLMEKYEMLSDKIVTVS